MTPRDDGLLDVRLARSGDGRTAIVERRQRFPLRLTVPLYLDERQPGMAFLYVQNPTGGVFGGDRLVTRVTAGAGARVHLTTTSATKVHPAHGGLSSLAVDVRVGPDAYVEYVPDPLIPYAGAQLDQDVRVDIASGGSFFYAEALAPGRVARDETFAYERLELRTTGSRDGRELFADTLVLEPGRRPVGRRGFLGRHWFTGTAIALGGTSRLDTLLQALDGVASSAPEVVAAACELPTRAGVLVRVLGSASLPVQSALDDLWRAARCQLLGTPPPRRRK